MTAETLLREGLTLDAQYFGGYAVECSLKALILHLTPDADKPDILQKVSAGASMHRLDVLLGRLRNLGVATPLEITKRIRRLGWTTDLRYEVGRRDTGETIAFLRSAKAVYDWVKGQVP
jgi:HEPN domain-containing protein